MNAPHNEKGFESVGGHGVLLTHLGTSVNIVPTSADSEKVSCVGGMLIMPVD